MIRYDSPQLGHRMDTRNLRGILKGLIMIDINVLLDEAATRLKTQARYLQWRAWPEVFGSTSWPRGGVGGQSMTTFQVVGFEADDGQKIKWCSGMWKKWDGQHRW